MQLAAWLILFVSLASCKHGAKVTACVTDVNNLAFQCSENGERQFSIAFEQGYSLECTSPEDTEYFLKACKKGEFVEVTQCRYKDASSFLCVDVTNQSLEIPMQLMDNYFCLSSQHRSRVIDRCRN